MSTITILGSPRRACSGLSRRETLKVGALSLLGGLFNTQSLLAVEREAPQYLRPARAKSVVLLYLQGGAPTQDMFDRASRPIAVAHGGQPIREILA